MPPAPTGFSTTTGLSQRHRAMPCARMRPATSLGRQMQRARPATALPLFQRLQLHPVLMLNTAQTATNVRSPAIVSLLLLGSLTRTSRNGVPDKVSEGPAGLPAEPSLQIRRPVSRVLHASAQLHRA